MIKAILFDMGGVVSTELGKIRYTALSKLSRERLNWRDVEKRIKPLEHRVDKGIISSDKLWRLIAIRLKISDYKKVKNIYSETISKKGRPKKRILSLVGKLKRKRCQIGILSNTFEADAYIHKKLGDYKFFYPVILSYEIGYRKPEEKIYQIALKRLKVKPEECVFIDNKKDKLLPAEKLGIKTILFKSVSQLGKKLNKLL